MVQDWMLTTMYATKRRRRSVKTVKPPMKDPPKSNPSKRHRERLNSELDHLASLLPFEQSVISKLDKLSILRLAVSYLRTKSYFQAALHERYALDGHHLHHHIRHHSHHLYAEPGFTDTDSVLQALSGFLFVVTCDGEVFFASRTVEQYLGFHQSDIIHQSALELIHSEDRDEFKNQLNWRHLMSQEHADLTPQQAMLPENNHLVHRCFTVRFRCLLDNTSGFITLEISGRIKLLTGQSLKGEEPPLALFALCCPFGPLPLLDVPARDYTFKSKHKMDMAPVSMDPRGKLLFGYSDRELMEKGGYDLIHPDDLTYYAAAHQELIKTGSSGLIAYRLMTKDFRWIWLQTSSKVIYKNSKPDFVICTHRHLTEDEGRDLVGKRGSEFKLPYPIIDTDPTGLGTALEEEEYVKVKSPKSKKSKTQLRDYLQAGRKRKTPYRDVYNGFNGYNPYTGINGYPACQPTDMKPEFMYPYAGQNLALDTTDLYRSGYHAFTGTMYPASLDTDKHNYANGYYLEPRQYQHTLQYHGNGYSELMAQSTKYSYDMSKYTYDQHMGTYGLDLTKRSHYDDELSRYESDLRKYSDYSSDKLCRVNGSYDTLRAGSSLYGANSLLNNESLLPACTMSHVTSPPCSLYRNDTERSDTRDASKLMATASSSTTPIDYVKHINSDITSQISNSHASVIRNASPRKSPQNDPSQTGNTSAMYPESSAITGRVSASWASCSNSAGVATSQCNGTSSLGAEETASSPLQGQTAHHLTTTPHVTSRIVSPSEMKTEAPSGVGVNADGLGAQGNPSPASATTATSVIQSSRQRSCEKQQQVSGGIAVPVVKSSAAWLQSHQNHLNNHSYNWHSPTSTEAYSTEHRSTDAYTSGRTARTIMETPRYASMKAGGEIDGSHAGLPYSHATHPLLTTN